MAVLKYYNTATSAWEYIAASTTANFTTWKKTMAGGETSVSGTDDNAVTLSYTVGLEQVFINGALQARGSDYTATTGTTVTGLSALGANDIVSVVCYAPFNVTNTYTKSETDGVAAAAPGMRLIVPTSVSVGSGSGSANAAGFVTFSGASSVSLNGVFSSTYDNYRIVVNVTSSSTNFDPLWLRMRSGTTDNSSSNYRWQQRYFAYGGSGGDGTTTTGTGFALASVDTGTTSIGMKASADVIGPFVTSNTSYSYQGTQYNYGFYGNGIMTVSTSYDGCSIVPNSGNVTGTIGVYGYKD